MLILDLLKKDHIHLIKIYEKLKDMPSAISEESQNIFNQFKKEILSHNKTEEKCFYHPMAKHKMGKEHIQHSLKEHKQVEGMLKFMEKVTQKDEETTQQNKEFFSTLEALNKELEHHIREEEDKMFKIAHQFFTKSELIKMGEKFIKEKEKIEMGMGNNES